MITLPDNIINNQEEFLSNLPLGIILFDKNGYIYFLNKTIHDFQVLYPNLFNENLIRKNIFTDNIITNKSIENDLNEIKKGYPVEIEIGEISLPHKANIKLIIKGTPFFEDAIFNGGVLIIEDLKIVHRVQKEFALRNDYLQRVAEHLTDLFIVIDKNNLIQFISGNTSNIFTSVNDYNDKLIFSLINNDLRIELIKIISNVRNTKQNQTGKVSLILNDDELLLEVKVVPQFDNQNYISFFYIFFKDVTSVEKELTEIRDGKIQSECYSVLNEAAGQALFSLTDDNKILYWDKNCEIIFGYRINDVKNNLIDKFITDLSNRKLSEIKSTLKSNPSFKTILTYKYDNQIKYIECYFSSSKSNDTNLLVLCKDVTNQIKSENEIKKSVENLSILLDNADLLVSKMDESGNFLYANKSFCETLKYSLEDIKQKRIYDLIDQEYFENNIFDLRAAEKKSRLNVVLPFWTGNKELIKLSLTVVREIVNEGTVQFDCYLKNLDDQKEKEKEAKLFYSILGASNDGIATGYDGKIIFANESFAKIFKYESGEKLIGRDMLDLVSSEDTFKVAEYFRLLERNKASVPSRFDFLGRKSDDSIFYAEISAGIFEFEKKAHIVMIVRDVSERIRAQRAIRESEEKYRNITENIDDFLFTFERIKTNLRAIFCTTSVQKITGYTQTDFLTDGKLFLKIIHPDDFQVFKPKLMNLLKSRIQNSAEFEFRIINKHGNIVWVRTKLNLVRTGTGKIQKIFGLVSDITFRKRAEEELRKSTQNLIKLNETKDRFISIVSHDLRTPFSSILGFTDLLLNDKDLTEDERKQYIRYIQDSSNSMLALVNSLLDWTRLQTGRIKFEPQKIDAVQIINDTVNSLSGVSIQKGIDLINLIKEEKPIFADKNLINQVFNNLISNAIKFTNSGGKVYISASPSDNPRFIDFSVKDTGVGIKEENLKKLFSIESKFTSEGTKGEKGSGLGLSLVKEIVERHGGKISVRSKYGEGSDFKFTMPIASAKILIVDDNKTDRLLYSKILKNITPDYDVDIASNGKEALEKIKATNPALVITDHSMPVMNGYEFVLELQKMEMRGKPPIIVLSSDIDRNAINDYNGIGIEFVFQKPVNLGHFKQAVEKSLRKSFSTG